MKRRSSIIAAWALVGVAGLSLFSTGDAPQFRSGPPGIGGAKAGKSAHRSGGMNPLSPETAAAAIRNWLKSPADRATPPLDAIRALSAAAVEEFLRDPQHGWYPLLDPKPQEDMAHLYEMRKSWMPFHKALLERWAEVDFQGAVAKIPPTSDYNEDSNLSWVIFTTAAKTDPAMAFQALQDWHGTIQRLPPFLGASYDVMQAWSAVDPESSWQWLTNAPRDEDEWRVAAQGYLKGLAHLDWQELLGKAETLSGGAPNKTNPRANMRLEVIGAWGSEDPLAALAAFERQSADPIRNPYSGNPADPEGARLMNFSILLERWMAADPGVIAKLQSWQAEDFNTDGVFRLVAYNGRWSDAVRQQARDLIRDPKMAAEVTAQMGVMQFCSMISMPPVQNQK